MTTAANKRPPPRVVHLRLDLGAGVRLGPGRVDLLQAIADHGSIRAAGRALGMSVKKTAQLVEALNRSFREPLIAASKGGQGGGGGASLTSLGRDVLAQYRRAEQAAMTAAADEIAALQAAARGRAS